MADKLARVEARSWTLVDAAAEQIRGAIARGDFGPGDQIPTERELAEQLGVSRVVLREALSSLEALGMIERRSTRGRFVAAGGSATRSRSLVAAWLHQHTQQIAELNEMRVIVEAHTVRTFPEADIDEAVRMGRRLVLDQAAALSRESTIEAVDIDQDLHWLFVSHSPNAPLRGLGRELIDQSRDVALAVYSLPSLAAESVAEHDRILDALAEHKRDLAAERLSEHHLRSLEPRGNATG
jgi:DNA-binding FadR family transcriptional regulator